MSLSPRPASAPSNLRSDSVEPGNTASYQTAFGQWPSTRGRRPELQDSQISSSTLQIRPENLRRNLEQSSTASQSLQHSNETAGDSATSKAFSDAEGADPWKRKTLLTLDGGGVRGYSSLLILRDLMREVAVLEQGHPQAPCSVSPLTMRGRPPLSAVQSRPSTTRLRNTDSSRSEEHGPARASSHYLPCHYFDYIAGTSTGGLIAIMLSRLSMNVEECIEAYERLADRVFGHPRRFHIRKPPWVPRDKYNHENLEDVIKEIVCRKSGKASTLFIQPKEDMCRTIVVAWQKIFLTGIRFPYLMRSYRHPRSLREDPLERNTGREDNYPIWKVARATSAAPLYFESVRMEEDDEKFELIDGGFGANNPTEEAYRSVKQLHSKNPKAVSVLVSIGTGKNLEQSGNPRTGYRLYLRYVNAAAKWATDSEKTHETVSDMTHGNAEYFRLNVEHGIGKMKLDAWKGRRGKETLDLIRAKTDAYLATQEAHRQIVESARHLVRIRRLRSSAQDSDRWERYCHGVEYACCIDGSDGCGDSGQRYTKQGLRRHLEKAHPRVEHIDIEAKLEAGKQFPLYDLGT